MPTHRKVALFSGAGVNRALSCAVLLAVLLVQLPMAAAAKAPAPDQPSTSTASTASTFVVAGPGYDGDLLDPALTTYGADLLIARQIYDTLLFYEDGSSRPVPGLASSWGVSEDGLTWTFHLRSGVTFHDGTPLNAEAVVRNFRRWWDPADPAHVGNFIFFEALFFGFKGNANCLLTDVSASGSHDVIIRLKTPYSPLLSILAFSAFSIASPAAIADGNLSTAPVGSGPFRFVERIPGDRVNLVANAGYWAGAPRSEALVFRSMMSSVDRVNALKTGEGHVADSVTPNTSDPLIRILSRNSASLAYLGINRAHGPFGDLLVRQAIAHLVDKSKVSAASGGSGRPATQFLPIGMWGRDPDIVDYSFDPAKARALLAQAGYSAGITTTLAYRNVFRNYMPDPHAVAAALKTDFAAGGITLELLELDSSTFLTRYYAGEVDLFLLGWGADYPHPDNFFRPHFCVGTGAFLPEDTALCTAIQDALKLGSVANQEQIYRWASRRVHETLPLIPLLNTGSILAIRYNVAGVTPSMIGTESYRLAEAIPEGAATVVPSQGGSVGYLEETTFTSVQVPADAVASPTELSIASSDVPAAPMGLADIGHAFEITASQNGQPIEELPLAEPAAIAVEYSDGDVADVVEDTLALYVWTGDAWSPAESTCTPPAHPVLDDAGNRVTTSVCHFSRFALFGEPKEKIYLPLILR